MLRRARAVEVAQPGQAASAGLQGVESGVDVCSQSRSAAGRLELRVGDVVDVSVEDLRGLGRSLGGG